MTPRGKFITLEGGEGAGKSTQAARLAAWLHARGVHAVVTREPGGSPGAEVIRSLVLGGKVAPFGPYAEALFFAVARADHLAATIRPALAAGSWVVCDRFMDSTEAYQGSAGVTWADLRDLQEIAVGDTIPDLTLVLDLPAATGIARMKARGSADRFEQDAPAIHEARRDRFLAIARREPERCVLINADTDEATVAGQIIAAVTERLNPASSGA